MANKSLAPMADFSHVDLGTGSPTYRQMQSVHVCVDPGVIMDKYADAFVMELQRKAPLKYDRIKITKEEVRNYCSYLLSERIKSVHFECTDWKRLRVLWIPSFIQYALSCVGQVVLREYGITLDPVFGRTVTKERTYYYADGTKQVRIQGKDEGGNPVSITSEVVQYAKAFNAKVAEIEPMKAPINYDQALAISEKIASYEDEIQIVKDAMPRGVEGHKDTMSCCILAEHVVSMHKVEHPVSTYMAAFLNLKIQEELEMSALYRIQYDDIEYIRSALLTQRVI